VTKVLILVPTLDRSGAEKQFSLLATGLPRDEFDVEVIALTRGGPFQSIIEDAGIPVAVLNKKWKFDVSALRRLRRYISEQKPDVILSCLFAANAYARLATIGMASPPKVIISERCVDSWKAKWQLILDRQLRNRATNLVANSNAVAEFYRGTGFPGEKITVVPNGITPPEQPAVTRLELLSELNLPDDAKLIAFVGRLAPQKRLRELLWATQLLRQADRRAYFLVIGDGPSREELELYSRDVESIDHVRFLGHREDAAGLLYLMDVFWMNSEFEGMSNSLMEAMSVGVPCIVSDIPANRELVTHEEHGYVVPINDSVAFSQFTERLMKDEALAKQLGQNAQDRMSNEFRVEQMIGSYAQLLREV